MNEGKPGIIINVVPKRFLRQSNIKIELRLSEISINRTILPFPWNQIYQDSTVVTTKMSKQVKKLIKIIFIYKKQMQNYIINTGAIINICCKDSCSWQAVS